MIGDYKEASQICTLVRTSKMRLGSGLLQGSGSGLKTSRRILLLQYVLHGRYSAGGVLMAGKASLRVWAHHFERCPAAPEFAKAGVL